MKILSISSQPALSQPGNTPSSSKQAGDGHLQLRHLQQRLKETSLSNKQLDETIRTELETSLIVMVRYSLEKTTPTYQERSAQMIIDNWEGLSDKTKTLITSHCKTNLENQGICKHYKEILETILERTSPSAPATIEPPTPEAIAPSTSEIQEEPSTLPPITTQHVQWNNVQTTEHKPLALLPFSPSYKQGNKIRWFENKDWRTLKNELKQKYVETEWKAFSKGANIQNTQNPWASDQTKQAMLAWLKTYKENRTKVLMLQKAGKSHKDAQEKLNAKAEKYINKKVTKALYQLDKEGNGFFRTKGTDLCARVYRVGHVFYQPVNKLSRSDRKAINQQEETQYRGGAILSRSETGVVHLAKRFGSSGEPSFTFVAAKVSDHVKTRTHEHGVLQRLSGQYFSGLRDLVIAPILRQSNAKQAILFSDFHARGNLLRVLGRLQKVKNPDIRKQAAQTLAGQLVDAIHAMHNQGITHMDLKPKHILLSKQGTVVLSHFGLATHQAEKAEGPPEPSKYMSRYAAPEDELGLKRATRPCDLYSLAALLKTIQKTARLSKDDPIRQLSNLIHAKRLQPNAWEEIQLAKQESGLNNATDLNEVLFPNKPSAPAAV